MSMHTPHSARRLHVLTRDVIITTALAIAFTATEAFADGVAVRRDRSTTVRTWSGPRTSGATARRVDGDRASRTTTARTRDGREITGSRHITRDGDDITVDREVAGRAGGSLSKRKHYEIDDGRVESVERSVIASDRSGRTTSWDGRAERENGRIEFEGEGHTRSGRHVAIEGAAARGPYGAGIVADVEGGRYGDRTVVAGRRYGGPTHVGSLPSGARPHTYGGWTYYYYGGLYYRPYTVGRVVYYGVVPPPVHVSTAAPPIGAISIGVGNLRFFFSAGVFYGSTTVAGVVRYRPVPPPVGVVIPGVLLPADRVTVGSRRFVFYGDTFYTRVIVSGQERFVVAAPPAGLTVVASLPAHAEPVLVGSVTYFRVGGRYYVPQLAASGVQRFVLVDAPTGLRS
jgi:hypothetical protein